MAWPEISIEDFPPERDDEPSSLRQDIIDELTDHFACALNRELLKNPDEQTAKHRVLNQFGDPIKIARQLWLDAMKEKIMSQRILTGVSVVMAVCGFIVVGLVWTMMNQNEQVNLKMLEQLASIADRPQPVATSNVDQKILKQLEQLNQKQNRQVGSASEGMNQISIQLVQDNKEKTPAVGFTGKLVKSGAKTDSFSLKEVSDAQGILDFGNLPWGKYELHLTAPWGDQLTTNISTIPGRNYQETIVCPAMASPTVPVTFELDWPEQMKVEEWIVICDFRQRESDWGGGYGGGTPGSLVRTIGDQYWNEKPLPFDQQSTVALINSDNKVSLCPLDKNGELKNVDPATVDWQPSVNLTSGAGYVLSIVYLIPKTELGRLSEVNFNRRYAVLDKSRTTMLIFDQLKRLQPEHGFTGGFVSPSATMFVTPFQNPNVLKKSGPLDPLPKVSEGIQYPNWLTFSALQDQNNLWTIPLIDLKKLNLPNDVQRGGVIGVNGAGQGFF